MRATWPQSVLAICADESSASDRKMRGAQRLEERPPCLRLAEHGAQRRDRLRRHDRDHARLAGQRRTSSRRRPGRPRRRWRKSGTRRTGTWPGGRRGPAAAASRRAGGAASGATPASGARPRRGTGPGSSRPACSGTAPCRCRSPRRAAAAGGRRRPCRRPVKRATRAGRLAPLPA